jgi:hypothetical protein
MLVRMWEKSNPHTLWVGMQASVTTLENNMEAFKKLNIDLPYDPATPLLETYPRNAAQETAKMPHY